MNQYVLDANILFSGIISQKAVYKSLFTQGQHIFFTPDFVLTELDKYHKVFLPKDVAYLALNEELGAILLTRDKSLYDGLQTKGYSRIQLFNDFIVQQMAGIEGRGQ